MTDYKLVHRASQKEIEDAVNEELKNGWQLVGGVAAVYVERMQGTGNVIFFQAMAKGDDEEVRGKRRV